MDAMFDAVDDRIDAIFHADGTYNHEAIRAFTRSPTAVKATLFPSPETSQTSRNSQLPPVTDFSPPQEPPRKRARRVIEEDYDDSDDEDEDERPHGDSKEAPTPPRFDSKRTSANKGLLSPSKSSSSPDHSEAALVKTAAASQVAPRLSTGAAAVVNGSSEIARQQLENAKNATQREAIRSFHTMIHTLENDHAAMIEQERLEETEKQIQAEMDKGYGPQSGQGSQVNQGTLSSANLGASNLTFKYLIARIDLKREKVQGSDAELRALLNEVRKNRSKWANEDQIGQEELYEALEKVLSELKAHTEYSTPFLRSVNKREAPDYYAVIKQPMDLGTMTKKLKQLAYKSKAEFVRDLHLIWENCLGYNHELSHPLRRMANGMRREAEKLIPLIPDISIRSRASLEAEERRKQLGVDEDSDDEPIMSSRGRPIAGSKKGAKNSRKAPKAPNKRKDRMPHFEQSSVVEKKPVPPQPGSRLLGKNRDGSELLDAPNGLATPPMGSSTPLVNGVGVQPQATTDAIDMDGPSSINGLEELNEPPENMHEDDVLKVWKQITKKDRARITKARHIMFKGNKLDVEAPALLRTRAGVRKFLKRKRLHEMGSYALTGEEVSAGDATVADDSSKRLETLAEGMEAQEQVEDAVIPDYYDPLNIVPDIPPHLQWNTDADGIAINPQAQFLRLLEPGYFIAPPSTLTKKMDNNLRQIQNTRKLCSKIGVVKQMQLQTQIFTNQFPKYHPEPFVEADIEPHVYSGEVPTLAGETCQAALRRTVAKIFYHAGFEETQPSAIDAMTDIAGDYFERLVRTFNTYREADKREVLGLDGTHHYVPRFTPEEVILHTLYNNGTDVDTLDSYVHEDMDRLTNKLNTIHDRMKSYLTDLLRPALTQDAGPDGAGAFNDNADTFVTGDFAEELGDDFFGFRALGLDKELGLDMLSVPLHLLQSRVRNQFRQTQAVGGPAGTSTAYELPALPAITKDNVGNLVGMVRGFFENKLTTAKDGKLVEDRDLPVKQQKPRPRLGATGKIISPQKRPPKEQIALSKKKKKLEVLLKETQTDAKRKEHMLNYVKPLGLPTVERIAKACGVSAKVIAVVTKDVEDREAAAKASLPVVAPVQGWTE